MEKIGLFFKDKRRKKRIKATEIADALNLSKTQISRYETERNTPPIPIIIKISKMLEFNINEIYPTENNTKTDGKNLGEKIKTLRDEKKLTQQELAKNIKTTTAKIGNYERNESYPTIYTLIDIAIALDTSLENLLENEIRECTTKALILF